MSRKAKFKLEIRRVKLNPEQAVLVCDCYSGEWRAGTSEFDTGQVWFESADGGYCSGKSLGWIGWSDPGPDPHGNAFAEPNSPSS